MLTSLGSFDDLVHMRMAEAIVDGESTVVVLMGAITKEYEKQVETLEEQWVN